MKEIIQIGDTLLRKKTKPVVVKEIHSERIKKLIKTMKETLAKEPNGAALAAPQIGELLQVFVVSGRALKSSDESEGKTQPEDMVFINPQIRKISKEIEEIDEGCLSVRGKYGTVPRAKKITIRAYDQNGNKIERGASGLLAQIFQHEIDHLQGELFVDKATDLWDVDEDYQSIDEQKNA